MRRRRRSRRNPRIVTYKKRRCASRTPIKGAYKGRRLKYPQLVKALMSSRGAPKKNRMKWAMKRAPRIWRKLKKYHGNSKKPVCGNPKRRGRRSRRK